MRNTDNVNEVKETVIEKAILNEKIEEIEEDWIDNEDS